MIGESYRLPSEIGIEIGRHFEDRLDGFVIDPLFEIAAMTEPSAVRSGRAPSSGVSTVGRPKEFAHLAWRDESPGKRQLAGFVFQPGRVWAPYSVGGRFGSGYDWVRVDMGEIVDESPAANLRFAVIEKRIAEQTEGEPQENPSDGGPGEEEQIDYSEDETSLEVELAYGVEAVR